MAGSDKTQKLKLDDYDSFEDEFAFWPLNLVLIILGASVLVVSFRYLDMHDERILYNPWTYGIVTPIALLAFGVLLRTLVSRIIQKSMQMAFLLSLLVHLFLLVGAMNVVLSRLWPDFLDKLAKERHALKRESLQAPQYHRVTSTKQKGARPDHLKHLPTQHEATEVESQKLAMNLAESALNNLVSPVPKVERSANPHVIEQNRPSPAMPSASESAASLSRSELQNSLQTNNPQQMEVPRSEPAPQLSASSTSTNRSRSESRTQSAQVNAQSQRSPSSSSSLTRNELRELSSPRAQRSSQLQKSLSQSASSRTSQVPVPRQRQQDSTSTAMQPSETGSRTSRNSANASSPNLLTRSQPQQNNQPRLTSPNVPRRNDQRMVPQATVGQFANAFERDTAGGQAGPPAPSSLPVRGTESFAGEQVGPAELQASTAQSSRQGASGRSSSSNATVGLPQAPIWSGAPSMAGGVSGRSPSQVAADATGGDAAGSDVAGMVGSGKTMQRSRTGLQGIVGPMSAPNAPEGTMASGETTGSSGSSLASNSAATGTSRGSRGQGADLSPQSFGSADSGGQSGPRSDVGSALGAMARNERGAADGSGQESGANASGSSPMQRSSTSGGAPTLGQISVPGLGQLAESSGGATSGDAVRQAASSRESRRKGGSTSNLLAINEPLGAGGIAKAGLRGGELLPRRNDFARDTRLTDLETQRFARRDVGGPLAAGRISIPKPAFQQRVERLKEREANEETSAEPQTELAIERGLAFLARHQREDGSWRLQDFDTEVLMTSDTAATGLALLAFQGAGYTHKDFKYAEVCEKAIQFLRERQKTNGDLYIPQNPASDQNAWLYSHGIAAIAMCEAYGMTQDPELRDPAQRAVDFIATSQDKRRGGWRYSPGVGSDTSVSGWFMMALMSAKLAGLQVDESVLVRLRGYLELSQDPAGNEHLYRYNPYAADNDVQGHGLRPTSVMTSVGLLMRLYTGWGRDEPAMQAGAEHLLQNLPAEGTVKQSKRDTYYWYYATQVMFHMGGETWDTWHDELYPMLINNQVIQGQYEGSWNPVSPTPDLWARYGGRLYVTTMNLLSLEVTYRHLPLYEATGFLEQ